MKKFTVILLSMLFIVSMSAVLTGCKKDEHIHVFDKSKRIQNEKTVAVEEINRQRI